MRIKEERKTKEVSIFVEIELNSEKNSKDFEANSSPYPGFFFHLLENFSKHGNIGIKIKANADNEHHLIEDIAICLGRAFKKAAGEIKNIKRFGSAIIPMDDALAVVAVDFGGRAYFSSDLKFRKQKIEDTASEMLLHFLETLANEAKINLHILVLRGKNEHHKAESVFKALGIAISEALEKAKESKSIPSTKGIIG